jgi:hypothetical protein
VRARASGAPPGRNCNLGNLGNVNPLVYQESARSANRNGRLEPVGGREVAWRTDLRPRSSDLRADVWTSGSASSSASRGLHEGRASAEAGWLRSRRRAWPHHSDLSRSSVGCVPSPPIRCGQSSPPRPGLRGLRIPQLSMARGLSTIGILRSDSTLPGLRERARVGPVSGERCGSKASESQSAGRFPGDYGPRPCRHGNEPRAP